MKKCDLDIIRPELFYSDLWDSFCKNFSSDKELAFAFYYTVIDSAIPYQYLGKALSMSDEQFRKLSEENKPLIEKILYINKSHHTQRTEEASLLLNCLDEIEDREVKIVVLAHAITILGSGGLPVGRREIGSILRGLDEKIKELESREDDEWPTFLMCLRKKDLGSGKRFPSFFLNGLCYPRGDAIGKRVSLSRKYIENRRISPKVEVWNNHEILVNRSKSFYR